MVLILFIASILILASLHILIHLFPLDYKPANKGPKNYVVSRPDDLNLIKEEQKRSDGKYNSFSRFI